MKFFFRHSLPTRAWAAIILISMLSLITAISSGLIAWISEADAEAINTAGSIRMATYRISYQLATDFDDIDPLASRIGLPDDLNENKKVAALRSDHQSDELMIGTTLLINDMEQRLARLRDYQRSNTNKSAVINDQLQHIENQWNAYLKPAIAEGDKQAFYLGSMSYIHDVDELVNELQYRNERRQIWQQTLQVSALLMTILIMLAGMHELKQNVLNPVRHLIGATRKFKQGELDTRVQVSGYSEFRDLGSSFNDMAETIETYQRSLEDEVQTKTQHLVKANQALALLYDFAKQLTTKPVTLTSLDSLIGEFSHLMPQYEMTLCLQNEVLKNKDAIALHGDRMKELCTKFSCDSCFIKNSPYTRSYPINLQKTVWGELRVRAKSGVMQVESSESAPVDFSKSKRIDMVDGNNTALMAENEELIIALSNLISTALSLRKQRQQEHQLILLEERTTIARELHDSLAQSLSYLKIQVSMLEKHLRNQQETADNNKVWQAIEQIKSGLNSAYQELRELLVTFRLTIDNDKFDDALNEAANEFATKGKFDIQLDNRVMTLNLSATEQVNMLQIVREALSNISRHAHADQVTIDIHYNDNSNCISMSIIDDGVGISGEVDQRQHHGLLIMQERAKHLGGKLDIFANDPHGTIVKVAFTPEFFLQMDNTGFDNSKTNP